MKTLRRLSKQFSRQMEAAKVRAGLQPGQPIPKGMRMPWSANMRTIRRCIAQFHARIANIWANALHPLTTDPTEHLDVIAIEDFNVGTLKNPPLARAITADMGFGEFHRLLEYKAVHRGKTLGVVSRWYPSSKRCSSCGYKMPKMPLAVREWTCPACHTHHDRDVNAAMNLRQVAVRQTFSVTACRVSPVDDRPMALKSSGARGRWQQDAHLPRNDQAWLSPSERVSHQTGCGDE